MIAPINRESCNAFPSPASGRGAGGEGVPCQPKPEVSSSDPPALTLALSQGERGPRESPLSRKRERGRG